jgi:hypothetical protein
MGWVAGVQALAAAVSAVTAGYLARLTIRRDREARAEHDRDLQREQIRRVTDAVNGLGSVIRSMDALDIDFDAERAALAAALALRPVALPACKALLADDVPKPPYAAGDGRTWVLVQAAQHEILVHSQQP